MPVFRQAYSLLIRGTQMLRPLVLLALVGFPGLLVAADPEPTDFVSKEGRFKATFPGKVESGENKSAKGGSSFFARTMLAPDTQFTVVYLDATVPFPADKIKEKLDELADVVKG